MLVNVADSEFIWWNSIHIIRLLPAKLLLLQNSALVRRITLDTASLLILFTQPFTVCERRFRRWISREAIEVSAASVRAGQLMQADFVRLIKWALVLEGRPDTGWILDGLVWRLTGRGWWSGPRWTGHWRVANSCSTARRLDLSLWRGCGRRAGGAVCTWTCCQFLVARWRGVGCWFATGCVY